MNVSTAQLNRTAAYEGFAAKAYKDGTVGGVQSFSIGYGHQIRNDEGNLRTATLTKAQALTLLKKDFKTVVDYVNKNSKKVLNQNQFDALCDFGFNCGVGALGNVINTLNTKGYAAVPAHINQYVKWTPSPGNTVVHPTLVKRRAENVATWNSAVTITGSSIALLCVIGSVIYIYFFNNGKIPYFS